MDKIRIRGGARLNGEIPISGAKNAALPLMVAALLTDAPLTLTNVPKLADVAFMADLLRHFGVTAEWTPEAALGQGGRYELCAADLTGTTADYDIVRKMRASFLVFGPLLARAGHAKVSLPGGCAIGARPVDLHLKALEALGAKVELADGYVIAEAPGGLKGANIAFPFVSVGATENALMAATLAEGRTVISNAAREPEIDDLGRCLTAMGARISGLGTSSIVVDGVKSLHAAAHAVLPDRIETGTYAMAVAIAGGAVELTGTRADLVGALIPLLKEAGTDVTATNNGLMVARNGVRPTSVSAATEPFPGFPTDLQAQFMALMATAEGTSHIRETIFENRFMHVPELLRMGANIKVDGDTAIVTGVPRLNGAPVMATDLRASSSLVLAGLAAEGETVVNRVYHLDRGFERLEEKLSRVGADIERLPV
ncbi:MAG: UDP-N-acetylglucosamine 1-carboxyvinyltransferase [Alphaproteobacteria bacterium]|nr:UDP-N-acetylglucosamine 1-carboxyvinyltransferase [Alphaproteobacteria bacterium]MDE1986291.1 UDP-N-acetylglucosamine 1-carboxyvinyltransferase [Alphaproteobacteria bacterium]MDE2265614.1 UDP-N-acetylglucosamine 1-carboxyvinyltransferase [Alphaproteobacteria bacterium]